MKPRYLFMLAVAALAVAPALSFAAGPKTKTDIGRSEYMEKCAICHGQDARGTGGMTDLLRKAPADLTQLSKRNGGVFPHARVYAVIDGREWVASHGDRDMPLWGSVYKTESVRAAEYYADMPYDMEMFARARVLSLIDYLYRIQAK